MFRPRNLFDRLYLIKRVSRFYRKRNGTRLNWLQPVRFTEKIQWRKPFDLNPLYGVFSDKLAVRDYIATHLGVEVLPQLLWVGDGRSSARHTGSPVHCEAHSCLQLAAQSCPSREGRHRGSPTNVLSMAERGLGISLPRTRLCTRAATTYRGTAARWTRW